MLRENSLRSIFTAFLLAFSFLLAQAASAAVIHEPHLIAEKGEARDIFKYDISLTNTARDPITIYAVLGTIDEKEGVENQKQRSEVDHKKSFAHWVKFSRSGIEIPGGETRIEPLRIEIPPEAVAGSYHAFLYFPTSTGFTAKMAESQNVNSLLLSFIVDDDKVKNVDVALSLPSIVTASHASISAAIENTGQLSVSPKTTLRLRTNKGRQIAELTNSSQEILAPQDKITIPFEYSPKVPGIYRGTLSVSLGESEKVIDEPFLFFYFPWQYLVILLGLYFAYKFLRKRARKRK